MKSITQIESYSKEKFYYKLKNGKDVKHDVYTIGSGSKIVVIIQELPGIGQETLALADKFVDRGYTVILPHLFGPIGKTATKRNLVQVLCMYREFKVFCANDSSPIVEFLSALCSSMKEKYNVEGVAVIGMCLTGNFAISLMANEDVLASFASQPSLPLGKQNALHMSPDEIEDVKKNIDKVGAAMHCGHFKGDRLCTKVKMKLIHNTFNLDDKNRVIFHELTGYKHAILTIDFEKGEGKETHDTLNEILGYFDEQLTQPKLKK